MGLGDDSRRRYVVPIVFVLVVWTLTTHGKFSVSGDEPHYLIISESLLVDRDLDLENNYQNGGGRRFGAGGLTAGPHVERNRYRALWSAHDVGLPVAVLPIYAAATRIATAIPEDVLRRFRQDHGLFAYSLISMTLTLLTAWGLWLLMAGLTRESTPAHAAIVTLVFGLTPPVISHAFLVFPDTIAFAVVCGVVWLLCLKPHELTTRRVILVVAAVGLIPWLHRKYAFLEIGLVAVIFVTHRFWFVRQSRSTQTVVAALAVAPQAALHLWTLANWGTLGGAQMLRGDLPFTPEWLQVGSLGLLVDRERGLLGYAPLFLIVPACWALGWRRYRLLLAPVMLLYLPMAAYINWHGGFSPAGRYLVPIVPLLVLPVAAALRHRVIRWAALPLLAFQFAILVVVWNTPRTLWPKDQATNQALERIPLVGPAYERLLPSVATGDPLVNGWLWIGALTVITVLIVVAAKSTPEPSTTKPTKATKENPTREGAAADRTRPH
jgi:hypothetical protein